MATGTGLPALNGAPVLAQAPPSVGAEALFSAGAWGQIAQSGQRIAEIGADALERQATLQKAGAVADLENRHRDWFVKANDQFYGKPAEFEATARAHVDGALSGMDPSLVPHAKKYLGGLLESGLASQLAVKRSKDESLASESLTARLKTADDDVQSLASGGQIGDVRGQAAVATYNGVLDTAVATRAMSPEKATLLRDDLTERAQGNVVRAGLERVYSEKGFDEARKWLTDSVGEMGSQYKFSDKLLRGGLAWLRSEESAQRGDRDAVSREWAQAKGQGTTLPNEVMLDLAQRAYSVGNIRVGQDVETTMRGLEIAKQFRALPLSERASLASVGEIPADNLANRLRARESSGRPDRMNSLGYAGLFQFGAPRLADLGIYAPGAGEDLTTWSKTQRYSGGKWSGEFNIPGFPDVKSIEDFRANPDAQRAAYDAHNARMDSEIVSNGFDRYIGQTIGGVEITRDGLKAMLHLGGVGSTRDALNSGGATNAKDSNGTSVLEYARLGIGTSETGRKFTDSRIGLYALGKLKSEMASDIDHSIADLTAANRKSEFPSLDEVYGLGIQVAAVGTPEQKAKVAEIATIADAGSRFQIMTPPQRAAAQAEWTKRLEAGAPAFTRKLAESLQSADGKIKEAYGSDPYGAAYRFANGVTAPPAIDFDRPDLGDILKTKATQQAQIRADQDLPAFSALRPTEAASLAARLTQGQPAAAAGALQAISTLPREIFVATVADKPVLEALDGMVRSGDPARLTAGMQALDAAFRLDPLGFKSAFGGETLTRLQTWQGLRGSLTPAEIVERFRRADDPAFTEARAALTKLADKETDKVTPDSVTKAVYAADHEILGLLPLTGPSAPDGLQAGVLKAEYAEVYRDFRTTGLDAGKAHDAAIKRLKTNWSASDINGGQLMRNAPERFYSEVNGSRAWMRETLQADLAGIKKPGARFQVMADAMTEADIAAKRPPSYVIATIDPANGQIDVPIDATGGPLRYRWDDKAAVETARSSFGRLHFLKSNSSGPGGGIEARQMLDTGGEIGPR